MDGTVLRDASGIQEARIGPFAAGGGSDKRLKSRSNARVTGTIDGGLGAGHCLLPAVRSAAVAVVLTTTAIRPKSSSSGR